ncbi:Alcohol dehydrogenase [Rasamsonia emersonii CBS 393.64]|uniref:Alcohol dehydrogenase n=1 Tax=Rasamsonia emersonii (strain ATCC 16479 / CBS 393.64 / IMI 116815) TaxID=1408163 RepID=A0A0F4YJ04_RASE3|nr:Alcohol dehydrogenase [Rasamsonia emersonii CBS 393.64]KKA18100.1 Alcohol dehydrogenase [Rasamsonia emersonii CBS 393.64]
MPGIATLPTTQKALVAGPKGEFILSHDAPVAELEPDAVIIKTTAVALNPVDTKMVGDFVTPGAIFGFDCAGTVVAVGKDVHHLKPGDRVCGSADGMDRNNPRGGAFAEYVSLLSDMTLKIPDFMPDENAAALGTALASGCMAIFHALGISPSLLDEPAKEGFHVLVYGGSSSTGTMAIQLLKLCGLRPITTCSPGKFDFVKSYGAEEAFDYNSPTCAEDIRKYTKNTLGYAVDCITQEMSTRICYGAIGRAGGRYAALDPFSEKAASRKVVKPDWILATAITGRGCSWPAPYGREGNPALREFGRPIFRTLQRLLNEGKIKSHPPRVSDGGFEDLINGVGKIRRGETGFG